MNLYVIRHADAGSRDAWEGDDADRPLSPLGHQQARALGDALKQRGVTLDVVVSSSLVRARETAEGIVETAAPDHEVVVNDLLAPDAKRKRKLSKQLAALDAESVAIVGHDPDLPAYLGWLLGVDPQVVHLEKGGAALVRFEDGPAKGAGELVWMVTPEWFMTGAREPAAV